MAINFSVEKKFIVNGKEYGSVEEMPKEIRDAYEEAIRGPSGKDHVVNHEMVESEVIINGKKYTDIDAMPPEEREIYQAVMKAISKDGASLSARMEKDPANPRQDIRISIQDGKPIAPVSSLSPQKLIYVSIILLFLLGLAYLWLVSGR